MIICQGSLTIVELIVCLKMNVKKAHTVLLNLKISDSLLIISLFYMAAHSTVCVQQFLTPEMKGMSLPAGVCS